MKIGLVYYSQTGNTKSIAEKCAARLKKDKHQVDLLTIEVEGTDFEPGRPVQFLNCPTVDAYDALVFASPVHAFMLSQPMKQYLKERDALNNKKVFAFVTQHFRYAWMGGNRAVGKIAKLAGEKGASVSGARVINWTNKKREQQIAELLDHVSNAMAEASVKEG